MIMTEAMPVSEGCRNHRNSMCVFHDRFIPGLAAVVEAIKKHDVHVVGQLSHRAACCGRHVMSWRQSRAVRTAHKSRRRRVH